MLQFYWDKQGCVLFQFIDMEVGVGMLYVYMFLCVVGFELWCVVYVQLLCCLKDGCYGENLNCLQYYYQYQVVFKLVLENIFDLYLGLFEVFGFDLKQNDVCFVEDDWENLMFGVWGFGWEVWLNGMEVMQFMYFQEVGGFECKLVFGEIMYGFECFVMYLQKVENVYDFVWIEWEE